MTHDEMGREISSTTYNAAGEVIASSENVLDADGNIVERKTVDYTGFVTINKYDYVSRDHETICYNADGSFASHDVYKRNEAFEYIARLENDANGNLVAEYTMIKDADGNYTSVPKEA
jgi:hypothetical protein